MNQPISGTYWRTLLRWISALVLLYTAAALPNRVFGWFSGIEEATFVGLAALPSVLVDLLTVTGFLLPFAAFAAGASVAALNHRWDPAELNPTLRTLYRHAIFAGLATLVVGSYLAPIGYWLMFSSMDGVPAGLFPLGPWTPGNMLEVLRMSSEQLGALSGVPPGEMASFDLRLHRAFAHPALAIILSGIGYHVRDRLMSERPTRARFLTWAIGLGLSSVVMYPYYLTGRIGDLSTLPSGLIAWLPIFVAGPAWLALSWVGRSDQKHRDALAHRSW